MRALVLCLLVCACGTTGGVPKAVTCAEPQIADILIKISECLGKGGTTSSCIEQNAPAEIAPYIACLQKQGDKRLQVKAQ